MNLFRLIMIACTFMGASQAMDHYPAISVNTSRGDFGTKFQVTTRATKFISTADFNRDAMVQTVDTSREFMRAIITTDLSVINYLADRSPELPNSRCKDNYAWKAITYATAVGNQKVIAQLIALGADLWTTLEIQDGSLRIDDSIEMLAIRSGHQDLARLLMKQKSLYSAATANNSKEVSEILNTSGIYPNPVVNGRRLLDQIPATGVAHTLISAKIAELKSRK